MSTDDKPTPLEALAARQQPITDVVYGKDHPGKKPSRRGKPAPQKPVAAVLGTGSLVGDLIPASTRRKLSALQGKLEARQSRMNTGKGRKS